MVSRVSGSPYRPVSIRPPVRAGGGQAPAAQQAPAQTVAPASIETQGLLDGIKRMLGAVVGFVKGLFDKLFKKAPSGLDPDMKAIADQYGLLATKENVEAFLAEARSYEQNGTMGPGSSGEAVKELQTVLKGWGFSVNPTGAWDNSTSEAIKTLKRSNGLHQSYKSADGSWAVNEFLDPQTLDFIRQKLSSGQKPDTSAPPPAPSNPGTLDWQAIATQYKLLANQENVQAFLAEVKTYERNGTLGPGYPNAEDIQELQAALKQFGYSVNPTGTWDAATTQAMIAFKTQNGLRQSYRSADGNWAVNEYATPEVLKKVMEKLGLPTT